MKKILVVGGGAYQVPLIQRIREIGCEALCVDRNPDAPGFGVASDHRQIDVLDREACLSYAKEVAINAVMTYGATLPLPTVSYIGERMGLPVLPYETAKISTSKYEIKKRLAAFGCNIKGDFFEMHSMKDAEQHSFSFPCVIKPSDGSGSKGVSLVENATELKSALQYALNHARYGSIYAEALIRGEEYTVEAFVSDGEIYVYGIIKTTFERKPDGTVSYGHRMPSGLPKEAEEQIATEIRRAIRALKITMASVNFDVILSAEDGKPYIIDCGIRIGQNLIASHLVPISCGVSVIDNTIRLALGEKIDAAPRYSKCVATRLLIYRPGRIVGIRDMSGLIGKNGIVDIVMRKQVGDVQNEYHEKSDTCGWVITTGATPDEAEALAIRAKRTLEKYIIIQSCLSEEKSV